MSNLVDFSIMVDFYNFNNKLKTPSFLFPMVIKGTAGYKIGGLRNNCKSNCSSTSFKKDFMDRKQEIAAVAPKVINKRAQLVNI